MSQEPFKNSQKNDESPDSGTRVSLKTRPVVAKPPLYKVFLLNDDYTPMDFVVSVLETFFGKDHAEAVRIMMHVHKKGAGLCGVYAFEIAETKAAMVMDAARAAQHPLQCTLEKE